MLGLFFYTYTAIGLGLLLPAIRVNNFCNFGARFAAGYAVLIIYIYLAHVVLRISLDITIWLSVALATSGLILSLVKRNSKNLTSLVFHPGIWLILFGAGSILFNGGIEYLPYTDDEFTNWLGMSKEIFFRGDYESVRTSIYLPGYTPGWRLTLLLPWQFSGEINEGLSAAAPFVFHVAVIALIFDTASYLIQSHLKSSNLNTYLFALIFLLLFLAAEGMGKLWSRTLLIEPVQIYSISAMLILIYLAGRVHIEHPTSKRILYLYAGLLLASSYLLKVAASLFIPIFILFAVLPFLNKSFFTNFSWRKAFEFLTLTLGPISILVLSWSFLNPSTATLGSPVSSLEKIINGELGERDFIDLANRYLIAIWVYASHYKVIISIGAIVGAAYIFLKRRDGALLIWIGFAGIYFTALYWAHLAIFGEYYFHNLNSIQRFSRVPIQIFHTLGLILLLESSMIYLCKIDRLKQVLISTKLVLPSILIAAPLLGWQTLEIYRSVVDNSTRSLQSIDPRVKEMKDASLLIDSLIGNGIPNQPNLLIISQNLEPSARNYARYFAGSKKHPENAYRRFQTDIISSWPRNPNSDYKSPTTLQVFRKKIESADIIWPLKIDNELSNLLRELMIDEHCLNNILEVVIVKNANKSGHRSCIPKPIYR